MISDAFFIDKTSGEHTYRIDEKFYDFRGAMVYLTAKPNNYKLMEAKQYLVSLRIEYFLREKK